MTDHRVEQSGRDESRPILLKELLHKGHWQTYRRFCKEYNRVASEFDKELIGTHPSDSTYRRWLSGRVIGVPRAEPCAVLEAMFPDYTVYQLFEPRQVDQSDPDSVHDSAPARPLGGTEGRLITDAYEESEGATALTASSSLDLVDRRACLASIAAAAIGAGASDSLVRLLDGLGGPPPLHVGAAEVAAVESAADAYMAKDLALGGGGMAAAVAESALRWSLGLLGGEMTEEIWSRLSSAIGLLADRLGWDTYDRGSSGTAVRLLGAALDHAARGGDPDLRAHVMLDLSTVMTDAGHPRDGVEILRAALGDERISSGERANLHAVAARHCASAGQIDAGLRHITLAEDALARTDTAIAPDWARRITYASGHHDSALGLALYALGDVERARERLSSALTTLDVGRTRTGLRCLTRLAALHLADGDHDIGEAEGRRLITDAKGVTSTRVRNDLAMLCAHASRYGAPDLAADLSTLLAGA